MRPPHASMPTKKKNKKSSDPPQAAATNKNHQSLNRMIVHEYYTISVEVWQYKISRKVEFMDYQNIDYFSLASMVTDWMRYAGPNARKDFMDLVRSTDYNRRAAIENDFGDGYVLDFAVDHSDIMNEVGQFLVYLFIDNNGEIYYVGMGNEQRIMDKKSRNNDFLKHYMKHNSKIVTFSGRGCLFFYAAKAVYRHH